MDCPQCQHANPAGARFCNACGATLEVVCPACSQVNPPGSRFCNACGHNLAQPPTPAAGGAAPASYTPKHLADKILSSRNALEGERKQVTVLFADTVGFTALARDLDPEVVHEVMDHCFVLLTAEVHRFEGTINQYTGDGIMALFGAPIAHEDSPRRAVHDALGMQRAIQDFGRELQAQRGLRLQMRLGLNTGLVVVGKIGDDLRMDYTAVGDTTNLAARLQQLAQPGTVVISEATHKLVAGFFDTRNLGEHAVKGHTEPVHAFEVLRTRGRRTRLTVQGIIMARLDRLGEAGKRTVQLASVIGRQFLVRLLERIADLTRPLEGLLTELQTLELIYRQGLLPEPAYVFKHAMIQDVAYNSLLLRQRRALHRAVGAAIEELYPERLAEHYEELAHHFTQGEMWAKAMEYSTLAGDRAAATFANAEAKAHYAHALQAAARVAPSPEPGAVARLHAKYGMILKVLVEYEGAVAAYQRALELIRQTADRRGEIDILVGLSGMYARYHREEPATATIEQALAMARELGDRTFEVLCLTNRALLRSNRYGQLVEMMPDAEEALRLAREIGDPKLLAEAMVTLGKLLEFRAVFDRSLVYLHEGVELAQLTHAGFLIGQATFFIGNAHTARGTYEDALQWYHQLSDYASKAGDKHLMARVPNLIGGVHLEIFDLDEALRLNLEGDEVAQRLFPWPEPRGHSLVKAGLAYLYRGEHGPAEACYRRAEALLEEDAWLRWRWHIALLHAFGELALTQGHHDEAWTYAVQSLELATQTDSRKHVARAQRLQGEVLAASGRLDEAAQALAASVHLAEHIQTPREVWLGKAALGKVLVRLGRDKEAEAQLTQATQTIEAIAANLQTPRLHHSFLNAMPVLKVYEALGHQPPSATL